jgi:hypothetical protein
VVGLGVCARAYGFYYLGDTSPWIERMRARLRLEHGLVLGCALLVVGLGILLWVIVEWIGRGFGSLAEERVAVVGATFVIVGLQATFTSFLVSILGMRKPPRPGG